MNTQTTLVLGGLTLVGLLAWRAQSSGGAPYQGVPSSQLTARQRQERERYVQSQRYGDEAWVDAYMSGIDRDPRWTDSDSRTAYMDDFGVSYRIDPDEYPYIAGVHS